ncbi:U1 small nuclear ribonucleo protein of 70kDa MW N terminal-domain-containing protein [Jimgerdemannia flammicorona]|uniref:U1 small nuclear ribonucleo protein of 70kDa MW N terminal-domain-containing protein n=1 Tax=Jimgerdemannia flammicorona TaxID=994334 RepID=A0A433PNH5_9FUNG|nr:U1 small nuclear ribonucleo protein of 70kDa MW N terminal-domain-containing protein [Jimgerdemannia flammicorona]
MTDKLPPNLLKLFAPRPPLPFSQPLDRDPAARKGPTISGIAQFVDQLKNYDPDYVPWESIEEKRRKKVCYQRQHPATQDISLFNQQLHAA